MLAVQVCDLELGDFVHTLGDAHLYSNHFKPQFARTPGPLPVMKVNPGMHDLFAFDDFILEGFDA